MLTLLVDNYDSFTFNLFQLLAQVNGQEPLVVRNDQMSLQQLLDLRFDSIVISPGPGHPDRPADFGVCSALIRQAAVPLLGVCLGHQGLASAFGGKIQLAPAPVHGQTSRILHQNEDLFEAIPQRFEAVRYHSWMVQRPLPASLQEIAWTEDGLLMGLRHREKPFWGVQFHPESIGTEHGFQLLQNFRKITEKLASASLGKQERALGKQERALGKQERALGKQERVLTERSRGENFAILSRRLPLFPEPEHVFASVFQQEPHAFWLDSSMAVAGLSRFSFMGCYGGPHSLVAKYDVQKHKLSMQRPFSSTESDQGIFDFLREQLRIHACLDPSLPFDFQCGFVGYLGYEMKSECGAASKHVSNWPDAVFLMADRVIAFDHQNQDVFLVALSTPQSQPEQEAWLGQMAKSLAELASSNRQLALLQEGKGSLKWQGRFSRSRTEYLQDIEQCLQAIRQGESYEICLTNRLHVPGKFHPFHVYQHLRRINPAPYAAFLGFGELSLLCSSPERFLKLDSQGWLESKPIKGTARRAENPAADALQKELLQSSVKERSENLMIVDLLRNDLGRVCAVGSVHVPKLMDIETYATLHQMVSTVRGKLRPDMDIISAIRAAFPGGSMTGAPKLRTMECIDRLETTARGVYSGALGWIGLHGVADLCVVIRTLVLCEQGATLGAGGAIVALSEAEAEYEEILLKAAPMQRALASVREATF